MHDASQACHSSREESYDADGDLTAVTDGLSHTTSYAYDSMGDLITETDPTGGGTTTYGYDLAGRMTSLTDPDDNTTTWTYTHADEVATEVNPLGFATTYTYSSFAATKRFTGRELRLAA
jgi:YD repeat-containing protein